MSCTKDGVVSSGDYKVGADKRWCGLTRRDIPIPNRVGWEWGEEKQKQNKSGGNKTKQDVQLLTPIHIPHNPRNATHIHRNVG